MTGASPDRAAAGSTSIRPGANPTCRRCSGRSKTVGSTFPWRPPRSICSPRRRSRNPPSSSTRPPIRGSSSPPWVTTIWTTELLRTSTGNVLVVGDSISNGYEGNSTWRRRLWDWLRQESVKATFVGPLTGTHVADEPHAPEPPSATQPPNDQEPDPAGFAGVYASNSPAEFLATGSRHYAMWGRQLGRAPTPSLGHEPAQGPPAASRRRPGRARIQRHRVARRGPRPRPHDEAIHRQRPGRQPQRPHRRGQRPPPHHPGQRQPATAAAHHRLQRGPRHGAPHLEHCHIPVALADIDAAYGCDPAASTCESTYDGLHPNALGEYRIARAFGSTLHRSFGIGGEDPREPAALLPFSIVTPANLQFDGTQQGSPSPGRRSSARTRTTSSGATPPATPTPPGSRPPPRPTGSTSPGSSTASPTKATPTKSAYEPWPGTRPTGDPTGRHPSAAPHTPPPPRRRKPSP